MNEKFRKWEWKIFIPFDKDSEHFDIFSYLLELSP